MKADTFPEMRLRLQARPSAQKEIDQLKTSNKLFEKLTNQKMTNFEKLGIKPELYYWCFSTLQLDGTFSSQEKESTDEVDGQIIDSEVIRSKVHCALTWQELKAGIFSLCYTKLSELALKELYLRGERI